MPGRVLILTDAAGDAGSRGHAIAAALAAGGHDVTVIAPGDDPDPRWSSLGTVTVLAAPARVPGGTGPRATADPAGGAQPPRTTRRRGRLAGLRARLTGRGPQAMATPRDLPAAARSAAPDGHPGDDVRAIVGAAVDAHPWDALYIDDPRLLPVAGPAIARRRAAGLAAWLVDGTPDGSTEPETDALGLGPGWVSRSGPDTAPDEVAAHIGGQLRAGRAPESTVPLTALPVPGPGEPSVRLAIGPANMAGQGWAWAMGVRRALGVSTEVITVDRGSPLLFEADVLVPASTYRHDPAWGRTLECRALREWSHVLLEAGRPMFGPWRGLMFPGDAAWLRERGLSVGLVLHGSEIRDPARHAASEPWSPFRDPSEALTAQLQERVARLRPLVEAFDGPVFVSTPDLLPEVPGATWLPVAVDMDRWTTTDPVLVRPVPVVLHAPSRGPLKGTAHVAAALDGLAAEGRIELRLLEGVAPASMPTEIAAADLVLDQFAIGSYGVMAVQAMAAGRVVVGHVSEPVRRHVAEAGGRELPIAEATPETLAEVIRGLIDERADAARMAADGVAFARALHDGERSARTLDAHLGLTVGGSARGR